ncbi:MAG TPA: peptidylprolyl isomerase [Gaiellaceae bacterium]|nr:peptidylprolyl isomerase [Gaiellaceae bacterium]
MRHLRPLVIVAVALALVAAGCGGGSSTVPSDAVAVVNGQPISKAELDQLLNQAKVTYKSQKRAFPKAGSAEYAALQTQAITFLVQRSEFAQEADKMGIKVTDKQVEDRLNQIKKQYFKSDPKAYLKQLASQGLTDSQVRDDLRAQLVSEAIFAKVSGGVKVTDQQIADYYSKNKSQYSQPQSRDVRHILVKNKALAEKLYTELRANKGANFAALAKKYSQDPGSKNTGGKLTVSKGQTVPPFDQAAFTLPTKAISTPIHTQYGWHIIQALSDVRPAKTTPLASVKESIRQQLLQTQKNAAMTAWVADAKKKYDKKTRYQVGYGPTTTATTTT